MLNSRPAPVVAVRGTRSSASGCPARRTTHNRSVDLGPLRVPTCPRPLRRSTDKLPPTSDGEDIVRLEVSVDQACAMGGQKAVASLCVQAQERAQIGGGQVLPSGSLLRLPGGK